MRPVHLDDEPLVTQSQRGQAQIWRHRWTLTLGGVGGLLILGMILAVLLRGGRGSLEERLAEAQVALADGDYVEAVDEFSRVLDDDPDNLAALEGQLEAAARLAQAGQYDAAITAYQTIWWKKPDEFQMLKGLGEAYQAKGLWKEAASWYEKWSQIAPKDGDAFLALGRAHFNLDQHEWAVAAYERAESLGVNSVEMAANLGLAYYEVAQPEKAVEWLERAQELAEGAVEWTEEIQVNLDRAYVEKAMRDVLLDLDFSNTMTEGGEIYAIAKTGQKVKIEGTAHLVDGPWQGAAALLVEGRTTNESKNPSFETDTRSWASASLGMISRTTDDAWQGSASLRCTSGGGQSHAQAAYAGGFRSFDPTAEYAVSAFYKLESLPPGGDVAFAAYWMGGANPPSYLQSVVRPSEEGGWHRVSAVMTPDHADRTGANFYLRIMGASADGQSFLMDGFQIEQAQRYSTSYVDGSMGHGYSWLDRPHASPSMRAAAVVSIDDYVHLLDGKARLTLRILARMPYDAQGTWPETSNVLFVAVSTSAEGIALTYDADADRFTASIKVDNRVHLVRSDVLRFKADEWIDLFLVYDAASDRLELHTDGVISSAGRSLDEIPPILFWRLGSSLDLAEHGNFAFHRLTVFNRALTFGEIAALSRTPTDRQS